MDKGYPDLQDEAREQLAINTFLQQLTPSPVAFSVKQKRPSTLDDAVAATLEMESYVSSQTVVASMSPSSEEVAVCPVSETNRLERLTRAVEQLTERVEKLQRDGPTQPTPRVDQPRPGAPTRPRRYFSGECWNCHRRWHVARNCPLSLPAQQQPPVSRTAHWKVNPIRSTHPTLFYMRPQLPHPGATVCIAQ